MMNNLTNGDPFNSNLPLLNIYYWLMRALILAFWKIERWNIKLYPNSVTFAICFFPILSSFFFLSN